MSPVASSRRAPRTGRPRFLYNILAIGLVAGSVTVGVALDRRPTGPTAGPATTIATDDLGPDNREKKH
jgi:hypothetical protein